MLVKVLACGDRHWSDSDMVWSTLGNLYRAYHAAASEAQEDLTFALIEGCAKGADRHAGQWAVSMRKSGVDHRPFPADWARYGRGAGPVRNLEMLRELVRSDEEPAVKIVVAFHDAITESKGTANMVGQVEALKQTGEEIELLLLHHKDALI
jgi:hypothetical protein